MADKAVARDVSAKSGQFNNSLVTKNGHPKMPVLFDA
jgi:hypothetical protein